MGVGAVGGDLAGDVDVVLDGDRDAEQRALAAGAAARVRLIGFETCAFGEHHAEGVQAGVVACDPLEVEVDELAGGDLSRGDQLGLAGDSEIGEVGWVHLPANVVQIASAPLRSPLGWRSRRASSTRASQSTERGAGSIEQAR